MALLTPRYLPVLHASHAKHPGDGFYKYANGKWLSTHHIDPWRSENGAFTEIDKRNTKELLDVLDTVLKVDSVRDTPKSSNDHIVALHRVFLNRSIAEEEAYVRLCMTETSIPAFMGWMLHSKIPTLVSLIIQAETKPPYYNRTSLTPGSLTLPSIYYKNARLQKSPVWKAYEEFINICAIELGQPSLPHVIQAEIELSRVLETPFTDLTKSIYGRTFRTWLPEFDWDAFFTTLQVPNWETRQWVLDSPELLRHILHWVCKTDPIKVHALVSYHVILSASDYLRPSIKDAAENLFKKKLIGIQHTIPKKEQFLSLAKEIIPDAMCVLYDSIQHDTKKLEEVTAMADSIQRAAVDVMSESTLLSTKSRSRAIEKIHRMTFHIGRVSGSTSTTLDLPGATYFSDSMFHTIVSIHQARSKIVLQHTGKPSLKSKPYPCYIVNASYYTESNRIVIPWGILHWPFYAKDAPLGWNHGGIGATIGHEIIHAFDLEGSQYSPRATFKTWWTRKNTQRFKQRTRKVIKFYSKFKHYGVHLNGKLTISEDWADFGGIVITLRALKKDLDEMAASESMRKEVHRTFFLSYAVSWRKLVKKKKLLYGILTNVHTPSEDRVDRIVPHFQEWYDAFDIKASDALYLPKKDRLLFF